MTFEGSCCSLLHFSQIHRGRSKPIACMQLSIFHIEPRLKTCLLMIRMNIFAFVPAALPIYQFCSPFEFLSVSSFQFVVAALWWVTLFLSTVPAQIFFRTFESLSLRSCNENPPSSCTYSKLLTLSVSSPCSCISYLSHMLARPVHGNWHTPYIAFPFQCLQVHLNHRATSPQAINCVLAPLDTLLHLLLHLFPKAAQKQYRVVPSRHLSNNGCAPTRFAKNKFCS